MRLLRPTAVRNRPRPRGRAEGVGGGSGVSRQGLDEGVEAGQLLGSAGQELTPALPGAQSGTDPLGTPLRVTRDIRCGTAAPNGAATRLPGSSRPGPVLPGDPGWGRDPIPTPGLPVSLVPTQDRVRTPTRGRAPQPCKTSEWPHPRVPQAPVPALPLPSSRARSQPGWGLRIRR